MGLFRGKRPPADRRYRWPAGARPPTEFVGVAPGSAGFPHEFDTADGVPVRLHDMAFLGMEHQVRPPTLRLRFRYDDPTWTPSEAEGTPVAVLEFTGVLIRQWEDEHDLYELPEDVRAQVRSFDWYEPTSTFSLLTTGTRLLFSASRLAVRLEAPPAG
ncbi:hypothetical protein [Modestobacter versicolor]|uniref:Uncharacterized protein n=1 Tax=Modestobacter versicolor TaxID=429133 RepID=A0A323VBN6_9ACTN|nr:hypothetical protein [Modestobacter versicolor]MBB3676145.1 hypothetical protein [Modestobacter versicolor]PZA21610.1 hypothetical protein DMO24_09365 [Modestobacter versicolor]